MSATMTMVNGRPQRKQLSEQLDRLDSIIDALAEGLPAAVAAAAREGTQQAVKDAIVEIITNPELRGLMQSIAPTVPPPAPTATEPAPAAPSAWCRLKAKLAEARAAITARYQTVKESVTTTTRTLSTLMPLRRIVLVAVGVGVVAAVLGYTAPAGVAAITVAILALIVFLRSPANLLNPQFYAEDGYIFFQSAWERGFLPSLLEPYSGYLHVVPRVVAGLALLVPLLKAPLVFNLAAFAITLIPDLYLLSNRTRFANGWPSTMRGPSWACARPTPAVVKITSAKSVKSCLIKIIVAGVGSRTRSFNANRALDADRGRCGNPHCGQGQTTQAAD